MSTSFPVQFGRALTTLKIFAVLGILAAAAAVINVAVTEAEAKQPWALLFLILVLPGIWVVIVCCLATFSLRITDEKIEKLLANRWVITSKPLSDLPSASITRNTLQLMFTNGTKVHLAAMPLRDRDLLVKVLAENCPHVKLSWRELFSFHC